MQKYDQYKNSGVEWLGEIPEHWELSRLGTLLNPISTNNRTDLPLLSITREKGVILRDLDNEEENHNFIPDDLSNYKMVRKGQFGMNKMKAWQGSYGISDYDGIVSPAYFIFDVNSKIEPKYFHAAIRSKLYISFFGSASDGVRIGQWDLSKPRMKQIPFLIPQKKEQIEIANFLDDKTSKIDQAIAIKQKQIELLKERRQILIYKAVTRGLNDNVKLKDSGVEWIGEIPEHWEVKSLKYCTNIFRGKFTHRPRNDERLYDGKYPFFQTGDVARAGKFLSEYRQTLNDIGLRVSTLFPKGTIVMTIAANIGDISILGIDACFPDSIVGFNPLNYLERDFLYNSLLVMKEQFMSSTIKNTQMNLNVDRIGTNAIVVPPFEEQKEIVNYIETAATKIATAISLKEQEIEKLKEYKMSLIDGVVTGKVKVS